MPDRASASRPRPNAELVSRLYATHHAALVRDVARRADSDRDTAMDACQYAWAELAVYPRPVAKPLGWLGLVAVRRVRRLRHQRRALAGAPPRVNVAAPELALDARVALESLAALTPVQRDAVALVVGGYGYAEIAAILGISRHAVKLRVARSYRQLRAMRSHW